MIRVCIQNIEKYNEGELVFTWLELPATEEEIKEALEEIEIGMTKKNRLKMIFDEDFIPFEGWEIVDVESDLDFIDYKTIQTFTFEELNELAETLENMNEYELNALQAIIEASGYEIEEAFEILEEKKFFFYPNTTIEELAFELMEEILGRENFEKIRSYFDAEKFANDLHLEGYTETSTGTIYLY